MSDQYEQDTWDQDEVEIVDLGAPDRGFSKYVFALGANWHAAAPFRTRLVTLLAALCLLVAVLQPGASVVSSQPSGASHIAPRPSLHSTIYIIDCATTIMFTNSPDQATTWQQAVSTPSAQWCSFSSLPDGQCPSHILQQLPYDPSTGQGQAFVCSVGTPLPVSGGKNGRNR